MPLEQRLRELDDGRPVVWFIYSDHGIRLDEAGRDLYSGLVDVPLIVVGPGVAPRRAQLPVDVSLDLAATLVDLIGFDPPDSYDGVSLLPLLANGDAVGGFQERLIPLAKSPDWRGAAYQSFKLLEHRRTRALFDRRDDPQEKHNVISRHLPLAEQLSDASGAELRRRFTAYAHALRARR